MPSLQIELSNVGSAFRLNGKGSEWWITYESCKYICDYNEFQIFRNKDIFNGVGMKCEVSIQLCNNKNIARLKDITQIVQKSLTNPIETYEVSGVGYIVPEFPANEPPYIFVQIVLPENEFFRLQRISSSSSLMLQIFTDSFESGFVFGDDPDGRDLKWFVNKCPASIAESVTFWLK